MNNISVKRAQSTDVDFTHLIYQLDLDLNKRYQQEQTKYDKFNKVARIDTVVVAYENHVPVGCGCFKPYDNNTVEIKRMFVIPDYRGRGISKVILEALENWAAELGYANSILETGKGQPEAIGLYKKFGYNVIDNFGQYADMTDSVCFEKKMK